MTTAIGKKWEEWMGGATIKFLLDNSIFLLFGTFCALTWANIDYASYEHVLHALHFPVNDIGMALFFAIAAKEVREALLKGVLQPDGSYKGAGALSSWKTAALPVMATIGGVAGPAIIYMLFSHWLKPVIFSGWAIPTATDIAFAYLVAKMIFPKCYDASGKEINHPSTVFLLTVAIIDDGIGLGLIAALYPQKAIMFGFFLGMLGSAITISLLMWKRFKITSFWPYLLGPGVISWIGFFVGGFHPALALVPVVFCMPHANCDEGFWAPGESEHQDTLNRMEHFWLNPVELVLGLFGFVNAGVPLGSVGIGTVIVLGSLIVGKLIGIIAFTYFGMKVFGLALPKGMEKSHIYIVASAAGIGFTVALFVCSAAFPGAGFLGALKMGALLSFGAVPITFAIAWFLGVWDPKPLQFLRRRPLQI